MNVALRAMKLRATQKTCPKNRHRLCRVLFLIFFAAIFSIIPNVHAAYLGLMLGDRPDIFSDWITFYYDFNATNNTGSFTADGTVLTLKPPAPPDGPGGNQIGIFTEDGGNYTFGGTFSIDAEFDIDPQGNPNIVSGSLMIGGTILPSLLDQDFWNPDFAATGILLTGELIQFGFDPTEGGSFEFVFSDLDGDLAPYFHGLDAGVIMGSYDFPGNFQSDFIGSNTRADTAPSNVPVPGTLLLMLSGLLFFRKKWPIKKS